MDETKKKKAQYFYSKKQFIHIDLHSGKYYNGEILECKEDDFIIIKDRVLGELPVFYTEIKFMEPYEVKS